VWRLTPTASASLAIVTEDQPVAMVIRAPAATMRSRRVTWSSSGAATMVTTVGPRLSRPGRGPAPGRTAPPRSGAGGAPRRGARRARAARRRRRARRTRGPSTGTCRCRRTGRDRPRSSSRHRRGDGDEVDLLAHAAVGAAPVVGDVVPRGAGGEALVLVTRRDLVGVATAGAPGSQHLLDLGERRSGGRGGGV